MIARTRFWPVAFAFALLALAGLATASEQLQLRRGTAAQIATFIGAPGEVVVDTTNNRLVVQDGATAGGIPQAKFSDVVLLPSWQSYSPGVASVLGALTSYTVNSARYWQFGKNVTVIVDVTIVDAGTGSVGLVIDPPTTPALPSSYNGALSGFEETVGFGLAGHVGGSNIAVFKYDGTYPGATGNRLVVQAVYVSQ